MSYRKNRDGRIVFECNKCDYELETAYTKLTDAAGTAKSYGWLIRPHDTPRGGRVWQHYCQNCRDYYA